MLHIEKDWNWQQYSFHVNILGATPGYNSCNHVFTCCTSKQSFHRVAMWENTLKQCMWKMSILREKFEETPWVYTWHEYHIVVNVKKFEKKQEIRRITNNDQHRGIFRKKNCQMKILISLWKVWTRIGSYYKTIQKQRNL